jgi:uncharacterized phiE125 gp8 family phage protein
MMGTIVSAPPPLPVPLAEVKALLRISAGDEDALIAAMTRAAADLCEAFTGQALVARAVTETLAAATAWTRLGAAPVRAITGVEALAADGGASALGPGAYAIDIDAAADGWVRLTAAIPAKRIRVAYAAGMAADPNGVPEALRHGIVRLAAHLHGARGEAGPGERAPPAAITALWRPWRRLRLG